MMDRKRYKWVLLFAVILSTWLLAACGGTQAPEATAPPEVEQPAEAPSTFDGEMLLQERCTRCHDLGRVRNAQKTQEEWDKTVTNMIGRGAKLNDEEKIFLIDYLAKTYGP